MTDNILVVTHPDDIFVDGIRILHVGLDPEQQQLVSTALMSTDLDINIVNYVSSKFLLFWYFERFTASKQSCYIQRRHYH